MRIEAIIYYFGFVAVYFVVPAVMAFIGIVFARWLVRQSAILLAKRYIKRFNAKNPAEVEELHLSRERGLEMVVKHPAFAMLTDDIAKMFDEAGGINYVEYTVYSEKHGQMSVCIQRLEGETPAMQNVRLRKRIAELEDGVGI